MRKLKDNEAYGIFVSVWDDGSVELESNCIVDVEAKKIIQIEQAKNCPDVTSLDDEFVIINGEKYLACDKDDLEDFLEENGDVIIYAY